MEASNTNSETCVDSRERPIIFQDFSVRAILAGQKTNTLRIIKFPKRCDGELPKLYLGPDAYGGHVFDGTTWWGGQIECPYGKEGERLWVKETLNCTYEHGVWYAADQGKTFTTIKDERCEALVDRYGDHYHSTEIGSISSLFMPRWASRLTLRIAGVSVMRVCDINRALVAAEGMPYLVESGWNVMDNGLWVIQKHHWPEENFARLWDRLHAKPKPVYGRVDGQRTITHYVSYPWEDAQAVTEYRGKPHHVIGNPWVWSIGFEVKK